MQSLKSAGLTNSEAKVYLALLRMGSTTAGPLVKSLGMHRAAVYDTLDLLIEKGLVSFVMEANRKCFEAHDPERLVEYMESRKNLIERKMRRLKEDVPKLRAMRAISKEAQEGYVYKGKKGIKSVCEDVLRDGKEFLVFGSQGNFMKTFPSYFLSLHKRRAAKGIPMRIIRSVRLRGAAWAEELKLREERFLPEIYTTPASTWIYGDKVAVIVWPPDPMAFVVRSKSVADSYKKHFEVLWKAARP